MSRDAPTVGVIGAGSWGTALAMQLARNGSDVVLWARDPRHAAEMAAGGRNPRYLPDIDFPAGIRPTAELESAAGAGGPVLLAVPSQAFAGMAEAIAPLLPTGQGVAWACKGFEPGTGKLLHEVARDRLGEGVPLAAVTGPSFAREVALDLPTAVTVAGFDDDFTGEMALRLHGGQFRAYTSSDMVGAELGGAVKNVLAVATGIGDGMGLGDNARAALITRGLAEMLRLGEAMGARTETLIGLAGLGDLVLTCTGDASRNRRLGLALGRGLDVDTAVREIGQVVEGVGTAAEVRRLSKAHRVSMPISREVFGIIHQKQNPAECLRRLLARDQKPEHD